MTKAERENKHLRGLVETCDKAFGKMTDHAHLEPATYAMATARTAAMMQEHIRWTLSAIERLEDAPAPEPAP